MTTTLLAGVLLLTLGLGAQAHNGHAGQNNPTGSRKPAASRVVGVVPGLGMVAAQDTTKAKNKALLIAEARLQPALSHPESQERAQPAGTEAVAPVDAAEFNPETADLPAGLAVTLRRPEAPLERRVYRTRLVRTGRWASRQEAVEILTCTYAGPLVLAQLPATATAPSQVLAGPGYDPATPLRPLALTQEAVLRLCGDRAPQVRAYAMLYNLHFQQADEVARLLDYYNRIAVVK